VVVRIVRAAIVTDPFVSGRVYVRRFGMAWFVGEGLMFDRRRRIVLRSAGGCRAVRWNVSAPYALHAAAVAASLLRQNWKRCQQRYREKSYRYLHPCHLQPLRRCLGVTVTTSMSR